MNLRDLLLADGYSEAFVDALFAAFAPASLEFRIAKLEADMANPARERRRQATADYEQPDGRAYTVGDAIGLQRDDVEQYTFAEAAAEVRESLAKIRDMSLRAEHRHCGYEDCTLDPTWQHESGELFCDSHVRVLENEKLRRDLAWAEEERDNLAALFQRTHGVHHSWVDACEKAKKERDTARDELSEVRESLEEWKLNF